MYYKRVYRHRLQPPGESQTTNNVRVTYVLQKSARKTAITPNTCIAMSYMCTTCSRAEPDRRQLPLLRNPTQLQRRKDTVQYIRRGRRRRSRSTAPCDERPQGRGASVLGAGPYAWRPSAAADRTRSCRSAGCCGCRCDGGNGCAHAECLCTTCRPRGVSGSLSMRGATRARDRTCDRTRDVEAAGTCGLVQIISSPLNGLHQTP